jgi:hypothetical protein
VMRILTAVNGRSLRNCSLAQRVGEMNRSKLILDGESSYLLA